MKWIHVKKQHLGVRSVGARIGPVGGRVDTCHSRKVAQLRSSEKGDEDTHAGKRWQDITGKRPFPPHRPFYLLQSAYAQVPPVLG